MKKYGEGCEKLLGQGEEKGEIWENELLVLVSDDFNRSIHMYMGRVNNIKWCNKQADQTKSNEKF